MIFMETFTKKMGCVLVLALLILGGCKSMAINKVDYSQPIESVLEPDNEGNVEDIKHGLKFNILPLQYMETQDTTSVTTSEIRYIRGEKGYYYITAPTYQHVYLMSPEEGALELEERFLINKAGIQEPAFNQRNKYIELLDRRNGESYRLTIEGLEQDESEMKNSEENSL
ncbi:hypothetical protein Asal01_00639 [Fodinibius salicampi]